MCEHMNFNAHVEVNRLTDGDEGPVTGYTVDLKVYCDECKLPFQFVGVDTGYFKYKPSVDVAGSTLCAPIKPGERIFAEIPRRIIYEV